MHKNIHLIMYSCKLRYDAITTTSGSLLNSTHAVIVTAI